MQNMEVAVQQKVGKVSGALRDVVSISVRVVAGPKHTIKLYGDRITQKSTWAR